jgi:thermostable 8-oxoguanine DNA glycosylase
MRPLADKHRQRLEELKEDEKHLNRPDFLWHYMLQSFSTLGSVRGWDGLIKDAENYQKVTYEALSKYSPARRLSRLKDTLRKAKVRMPDKKAGWLADNFERIKEIGGPEAAKEALLSKPDRNEKIKFLKAFSGIGDKYARNIMMDVYHPDFRDSIAIDARMEGITEMLGLEFKKYDEHERFYVEAAHEAGLTGWELDRLIFNFTEEVVEKLNEVLC